MVNYNGIRRTRCPPIHVPVLYTVYYDKITKTVYFNGFSVNNPMEIVRFHRAICVVLTFLAVNYRLTKHNILAAPSEVLWNGTHTNTILIVSLGKELFGNKIF